MSLTGTELEDLTQGLPVNGKHPGSHELKTACLKAAILSQVTWISAMGHMLVEESPQCVCTLFSSPLKKVPTLQNL